MSSTTITNISYSGTTQVGNVTATYGIPVTAHIWGAGGGSSGVHAGAGGGYSQVQFVAKPGDILTVAVGQGGGAGGLTTAPPAPPVTFNTRESGYTGTVLYPYSTTGSNGSALISACGVWNNPNGVGGTIDTTWASIVFPVSGYYTIQGSSAGCGFTTEPQGGGTLYIDGAPVISLPGNFGGGIQSVNVYVTAGTHSVRVYVGQANNGRGQRSSIAFVINETNPPKVTTTPTGLPGASYIGLLFNSRFPPPNQAESVYALGNGDSFLDQWGVWGPDQTVNTFTRTYSIYFPATANVIFQMSCNNTGSISLDGNLIINRPTLQNPNTPSEAIVNVTGGTHTVTISAFGTFGALNRVGLIFGTGDQTTFAGGRGGVSEPSSTQGFGGGGGGATILSLNGIVIGIGAGGGGGATMDPTNINYITTKYTGSTATQPFGNPGFSGWPGSWAPVVIAPGTSGWYELSYTYTLTDQQGTFSGPVVSYCVVVDGVIVYGPSGPTEAGAAPPPANTFQKKNFVGYSYSVYQPGGGTDYTFFTAVYNFDYTSLNTSAITDAKTNGENGQDVVGRAGYTLGGGGGGGGGGTRGGNGGAAVSGANGVATGNGITGGYSGHNGLSLGDQRVDATGRIPYINEYYPYGGVADGGAPGTSVTRYVGSTATDPFHSVIVSGTSGYYIRRITETLTTYIIGYSVVVNGTVVYQTSGGSAAPPPTTLAVKQGFVGYSFNQAVVIDGVPAVETVECYSFDYVTTGNRVGGNGFIALEYQTGGGALVKDGGEWKPVDTIYVKDENIWKEVQVTYINVDGTWKPIKGAPVPVFTPVNGAFGALVRPYKAGILLAPPPPAPDYGGYWVTGYDANFMF